MHNIRIFEGKTTKEAIEKGLKELNVKKDMVEIKVLEEEKRSFFSILEPRVVKVEMKLKEIIKEENNSEKIEKDEKVELINDEEIKELEIEVQKFIQSIIDVLPSKEIEFTVEYDNNLHIVVNMDGQDINYLIGYRGDVLNSIQTILTAFISKKTTHRIKAIVDIGNYKEKRKKTLENLAEKTASQVIKSGKKIVLEPMTPYERKIIHTKLQDHSKVRTYSIGEEPRRKIVITLK